MKSHKSTAKRFRASRGGKGDLMRTRQGKSHLRRKKSRRAKAQLDELHLVANPGMKQRVRKLAPYMRKIS
jgi:large subunit ribosomal protein L35